MLFRSDEAKITVLGAPDVPGIAYKILGPIAAANIDVDMIVQNVGHAGETDFSFTVARGDLAKARKVLEANMSEFGGKDILIDDTMAKLSVVGVGMRSHPGVAAKVFETLANERINIQMISTSEIKITVVIEEKYLELAARILHSAFGLDQA